MNNYDGDIAFGPVDRLFMQPARLAVRVWSYCTGLTNFTLCRAASTVAAGSVVFADMADYQRHHHKQSDLFWLALDTVVWFCILVWSRRLIADFEHWADGPRTSLPMTVTLLRMWRTIAMLATPPIVAIHVSKLLSGHPGSSAIRLGDDLGWYLAVFAVTCFTPRRPFRIRLPRFARQS